MPPARVHFSSHLTPKWQAFSGACPRHFPGVDAQLGLELFVSHPGRHHLHLHLLPARMCHMAALVTSLEIVAICHLCMDIPAGQWSLVEEFSFIPTPGPCKNRERRPLRTPVVLLVLCVLTVGVIVIGVVMRRAPCVAASSVRVVAFERATTASTAQAN